MSSHPSIQGHSKPWYHSPDKPPMPDPEQFHPDSNYYQSLARGMMQLVRDLLGKEAYYEWAELVWPGDSIDSLNWMQIHAQTQAAYRLAKWDGERDVNKLAEVARAAN